MKISILCSSSDHPVFPWLIQWKKCYEKNHKVDVFSSKKELTGGDILFLISCNEIITCEIRKQYTKTLVIHASDLPAGRGWSPHIWQILEGQNLFTVTLLEAEDKVDTGAIWKKLNFQLQGHELADEINEKLFDTELKLMSFAIENFHVKPIAQKEGTSSCYSKRTPQDSKLDPNKTIAEQFNMLRVADNNRFPAFIDHFGYRYFLKLEKAGPVREEEKNNE